MIAVFIDTWYLIAITNPRDDWHEHAKELSNKIGFNRLVTSEGVLTEYLNFFSKYGKNARAAAISSVRKLQSSKQIEVIPQDHYYFMKALELYDGRSDKDYSLTDCFSMVIMKEKNIKAVATKDYGFRQEGFEEFM